MAQQAMEGARSEPSAALRTSDWHLSATRWTQITLTENDPGRFDPEFWIDVMRRSRSNAVCISAGGYMAFYPTRIPHHYRSAHLGDSDPFGTLVEGARKLGMHVMARVDPHAVHADAARAHPEWLARTADGKAVEHWGFPDIWLTCPFGPYNREFITDVAREIVADYDVDAIFANRWAGHGISYSEAALRGFRDETGFDLPREAGDITDPAWRAYLDWRSRRLSGLVAHWDDAVKEIRPHARFIPNLGGVAPQDLDPAMLERHYPVFFIDKQGRSGVEAPWSAGRNGKRSRAVYRDRPVGLITSIGPEHHQHRWKDSVAPGAEISTWIVDGFAQGAFPWFTKFNGTVPDRRWVQPVVDAFNLHARLESDLGRMRITADVALFEPAAPSRTGATRTGTGGHEDGFYHALVEARIPFEIVTEQSLRAEELERFKVLVLPDSERMSEAQCAVVRGFVDRGGSVVAAHRSSLDDEFGTPRANFGLGDVFGVDLRMPVRGPVKNNYAALTADHPLTRGFGGAERIIGGTELIGVSAHAGTEVPLRFIPDYPDLPMEEVYARAEPADPAAVTRIHPGGGRCVYFPFNVGALFWEALQQDHGRLIANGIRWALGTGERVAVHGTGLVDLALWEGTGELAVALVNLTNPMALKGPIRETVPIGPLEVSVALPDPGRARAHLLVSGEELAVRSTGGGRAEVTVPRIELLEAVHFTWVSGEAR
ncbi:family 10 glycosylhydrolase [Streptomonospora sediminis]